MTVIAYRDGIMAADTGVWRDQIVSGETHKIHRLPSGALFAASGSLGKCQSCLRWLCAYAKEGEMDAEKLRPKPAERNQFGAILVEPDGRVLAINHEFEIHEAPRADFYVEGCHGELMIGALASGATAEEAVRLAIQYGDSAAGDVQVERL